ncbi:uncharacterized protein LOC108852374 [Raphanus sativus]|uniref:Uncharacterized protein LOC108852374 n=1 Tax=Raphanus sativus TaxID=3726 RepID=A0A6J0N9I9_RAPSA|nr:uncharacterized protein LOC108852374 [Raphanus sativus]
MAATAALSYLGTTSPLYIKTTSYVSPLRMSPCLELVRTSPNAMAANSSAVFNQMEDSLHVCWRFLTWFTLITAHVLTSIIYHSFCARRHEELLLRRLIAPQVNQLFQVALKCQSTILESGSDGVSKQDLQSKIVTWSWEQDGRYLKLSRA